MAVKKSVLAALVAAGVTGGAAGALIAAPNLVSAQDAPTTQQAPAPDGSDPAAPAPDAPPPEDCEGRGHRGPGLDAAAAALGTDVDTLRQQLADGKTIAQVAEANGVDVQTVIDAMVADAKAHLDEEVANGEHTQEEADQKLADITDRITAMVNGEAPLDRGPGGPGEHRRGPGGPGLDAAAAALGTDADTLRQQLADGQTIAQVAEANGVDVQTVIDAMVADAKAHLDEEVANGEHTQEEADQKLADITDRITAMVNGETPAPPEGDGPQGRPGRFGPRDQAPSSDGTTATPQAQGASV